jgi:hypothetical protein
MTTMNRQIAIITIALLLCASAANAQDIETAGINQAQRCMYTVLQSDLARPQTPGDPARSTNLAVSVCEPDLMALALHFHPNTDKAMLHMHMIEEARRLEHIIVGDGLGE